MNNYAQRLAELQQQQDHELKQIGDQWQTPKALAMGLFWHFGPKIGPVVLDLFTNEGNQLAANFYTAEINAMTQDWAGDLKRFGGAAFANPPYSRPCFDEDGTPITGIDHVLQYCREQREQGAKIMLLLKAATSDGWWPEDADFIQFISGRIGFQVPSWYVPRDPKKDKPSSSGFASAVIIFDKEWQWERRPTERLSRHLLETQGQIIIDMVESRALAIAAELNSHVVQGVIEETTAEPATNDVVITESDADIADDNYHLDLDDESTPTYADKTLEQLHADYSEMSVDHFISLKDWHEFLCELIVLFGNKETYSHREVMFALTSIDTDGESTGTQDKRNISVQCFRDLVETKIHLDMTTDQMVKAICALIAHINEYGQQPMFKQVQIMRAAVLGETTVVNSFQEGSSELKEHPGTGEVMTEVVCEADGSFSELSNDISADNDLAPVMSAEWLKHRYMQNEEFSEMLENLQLEAVEKTIDIAKEIDAKYESNPMAKKVIDVIDEFFASKPSPRIFLNIRELRAAFRKLIEASIKEAATCLEA